MNSYAKFGGAARRHFSAICEKPMGAHMCPPGRARVKDPLVQILTDKQAPQLKIRLFLGFRQWNAFHMQECLPYQGTLKGWIKWILVDLKPLKD